jgi:hypothetical protein
MTRLQLTNMPRIQIDLPRDRTRLGELRFYADSMDQLFSCPCLGKSDNIEASAAGNPHRLTTIRNGDTPTGTFRVLGVRSMGGSSAALHSYGPHKTISIEGTSGDALKAKINGRFGLLIHGGAARTNGGLRPTLGCPRVSNESMAKLNELMAEHGVPSQVIVGEV